MSTGNAKVMLACALLAALGGCAAGNPKPILSAAELDSMIRVEVERIEPAHPGDTAVAALQP